MIKAQKMIKIFIALNLYLVLTFVASDTKVINIKELMESNGIVPEVIDELPSQILQITYPSGAKVDFGNELTPSQVKDVPNVVWEADSNKLYTLVMADPDAPNRKEQTFGEVRHWLVVNIPGNNITEGQTLFEYIGSGPPKDSGLHRYIFLVFEQKSEIKSNIRVTNRSREGRIKTKVRELIKEFDLQKLIAGNFYQAQWDEYVLILHKQLGGPPPVHKQN